MLDKVAIEKEVRHMLAKFGKDLAHVVHKGSVAKRPKPNVSRGFREEGIPSCDEAFSERMFANAKKKSGRYIVAEKGTW